MTRFDIYSGRWMCDGCDGDGRDFWEYWPMAVYFPLGEWYHCPRCGELA